MRNIELFIVLILSFCYCSSQSNQLSVADSLEIKKYTDYFKNVTFNIGGGVFMPQGKLNEYLGASPLIELNVDFPLRKGKTLTLVTQLSVPDQSKEFQYRRDTDTIQAKATFMFNVFVRMKESMLKNNKVNLSVHLGVGASNFRTSARNIEDDESKYEMVSAFMVAPGLELKYRYKYNGHFVVAIDFQYSPYKIEGALDEDIGQFAFVPRVMYRF